MSAFTTTRWSLIRAAAMTDRRDESRQALAELCRRYQRPVAIYLARFRVPGEDTDDLVQEFFAGAIETQLFARADAERGSFRAYLVTALRRFVGHRLERIKATKRQGQVVAVAEESELPLADPGPAPDEEFDRLWAAEILRHALDRLRDEATRNGRSRQFEVLAPFLVDEAERGDYAKLAEALGMRRNAVAVAVLRLRQRFQALVRAEVAETVDGQGPLGSELAYLNGLFAAS